jgi:hypothetical protein
MAFAWLSYSGLLGHSLGSYSLLVFVLVLAVHIRPLALSSADCYHKDLEAEGNESNMVCGDPVVSTKVF